MSWPVHAGSRPGVGGFYFTSKSDAETYLPKLLVVWASSGWTVRNPKLVPSGPGWMIIASLWKPFGLLMEAQ